MEKINDNELYLINDLIKQERNTWRHLREINNSDNPKKRLIKCCEEDVFNFYEYLAILINKGCINKELSKSIWKYNIIEIYADHPKQYSKRISKQSKRTELYKLYKKWSDE